MMLAVAAALNLAVPSRAQDVRRFADEVLRYDPDHSKGNTPDRNREPATALGAKDGPNVSLGQGGLIELLFVDNVITNSGNTDPDIRIFEVGPDVEDTHVAIRPVPKTLPLLDPDLDKDGDGFFEVGTITGATSTVDIDERLGRFPEGKLRFDAIQLIDVFDKDDQDGATVGSDIDAVEAIKSVHQSPAGAVRVIAHGRLDTEDGGTVGGQATAAEDIVLAEDAILTVSAWAHINFHYPDPPEPFVTVNAGLNLKILLNGEVVALDQSFEGETGSVSFFAAASYSAFLKADTYKLSAVRQNLGQAFFQPRLTATYHAIAARSVTD